MRLLLSSQLVMLAALLSACGETATLLRDTDGDGVADLRSVLLSGLNAPFGMALVGHHLCVAHTDEVMRYPYARGDTHIIALGPHTASLGLASSQGSSLPAPFDQGMFIGQHGSWNRQPHSGYKVIFVPFREGRTSKALPIDVLTGFLSKDNEAHGRPVGVAIDQAGALLVADDVGNVVWRISAAR